jgi:acetate kinase
VIDAILVVNAGSSSLKFQLFELFDGATLDLELKGQYDGIGVRPRLVAQDDAGKVLADDSYAPSEIPDLPAALDALEAWIALHLADNRLIAVGHRVVHGGPDFSRPVIVDDAVMATLETLVPLAPLHQPNNLAPIRAMRARLPGVPQVACFDTSFHRGHPEVADRFAIPDAMYRQGVRRYGFHGLSYEYVASRLPEIDPALARGRVIVLHLGSGASMCALEAGRSVDSTMGFTALDGLPMGTRPGQLDPGVVLHMMTTLGMDARQIERILYHESGLKGLSGISNDMRDLEASDAPAAKLAIDYFVYRIAKEAGALAAALGGVDGLVFTAGIGENSARIRARVCARCAWLGVELDPAANEAKASRITTPTSRVPAFVVPTNEELMIARHTLRLVRGG